MTYYYIIVKVKGEVFSLAGPFHSLHAAVVLTPKVADEAGRIDKKYKTGYYDIVRKEDDTDKGIFNDKVGL